MATTWKDFSCRSYDMSVDCSRGDTIPRSGPVSGTISTDLDFNWGMPVCMALHDEIQTALIGLADELWNASPVKDGFALIATPIGLRSALEATEQRMSLFDDDEWDTMELKDYGMISMVWNAAGPGLGSLWSVNALQLTSGRRIYI